MERDSISSVEIDETGRLHVFPWSRVFPYIYREAMEVHWDAERKSLYSPKPREWSYARWFQQILAAAKEQGCLLVLQGDTNWHNVTPGMQAEFAEVISH